MSDPMATLRQLRADCDEAYAAARQLVYDRLEPGQTVDDAQLSLDQARALKRLSDAERAMAEHWRSVEPPLGSRTTYQSGRADGERVHAVVERLAGAVALCGAGRITRKTVGRFPSADDAEICPTCLEAVSSVIDAALRHGEL